MATHRRSWNRRRLLLGALLLGCAAAQAAVCVADRGRSPKRPQPQPLEAGGYVESGSARRPAPGADIDPRALAEAEQPAPASAPAAAAGLALELGADRPALAVAVPRVPRAATASFTLADGRPGWITRLPVGDHIPSVAYGNERVFASGGFNTVALYALDARSGKMVWSRQNLEDNGPTAPLYQDGEVIFNTESCTLFVLDARSGRTRWKRWLGDPTLAQAAAAHGLIYASHPYAGGGQRLSALALKDGRTTWSRAVDGELLAAPVVAGSAVYAATIAGTLYRFDGRSGAQRWRRALAATTAPWIAGGRVYLSRAAGGAEEQVALDEASGRTVATLRRSPARYLGDVPRNLQSWPKVWAFEGSRPLLAHGRLIDTMAGTVSAAQPASGRSLWLRRDRAARGARSLLPPVAAGAQLVVAARSGQLYALDVDTGMTVWAYALGRQLAASPVVARGWIYVTTTDGAVIGLRAGEPSLDGWHMWGGGPGHNGRS